MAVAIKGSSPSPIASREEAVDLHLPGLLVLTPGRECTIRGLGRCRYLTAALDADGAPEWLTVIDAKRRSFRAATPDRVTKVHRTVKMRGQ